MSKKTKISFATILILLSCLFGGCASSEAEIPYESHLLIPTVLQDVYVYDQGDFISDDQEKTINNLLVQLEKQTTVEFAVITVPSLNDLTIEQYAVRLANKLGIGKSGEDNGILLLVSKADTKVRLEIGRGLQGFITDSISGRILDTYFVPARENDNYDKACFDTACAVINTIAESGEYEFSGIEGLDSNIVLEAKEGDELTKGEWIGLIILLIILLIVEWITGKFWGDGFGDGLVFLILRCIGSSRSSGGSFGRGRFNGGGSSR